VNKSDLEREKMQEDVLKYRNMFKGKGGDKIVYRMIVLIVLCC